LRKEVEKIHAEVFGLLKHLFGSGSQDHLIKEFDAHLVSKGKIQGRLLGVLKNIVGVKAKVKSGKLGQKEVYGVKRDAFELISNLTEYAQRADLVAAEKGVVRLVFGKGKKAELVLMGDVNYLVSGDKIKKISAGKLIESDRKEFEQALSEHRAVVGKKVSGKVWDVLRKELGDFSIVL
jgi:hypothetical protein